MYPVNIIAQAFLSYESMSPKKLQKLCYYAQMFYLALFNKKIINGEFEAWIHGSVNRELFYIYQGYKWTPIPKTFNNVFDLIDNNAKSVLNIVWSSFGKYNGDQLEVITHTEIPWLNARKGYLPYEPCSNVLNHDDMKIQGNKIINKMLSN